MGQALLALATLGSTRLAVMQFYSVRGGWEHQRRDSRWIPWQDDSADGLTGWFKQKGKTLSMYSSDSKGAPGVRFARGELKRAGAFELTADGIWGTNPGLAPVVDVWGDGIAKLASLAVTNQTVYDQLFG